MTGNPSRFTLLSGHVREYSISPRVSEVGVAGRGYALAMLGHRRRRRPRSTSREVPHTTFDTLDNVTSERDAHWTEVSRRNARSVQTIIGWIFWDPGAIRRYEELGIPAKAGYLAARCAPFFTAGSEALIAALGSISPDGVRALCAALTPEQCMSVWSARNEAVREGLHQYAPGIVQPLEDFGPDLWRVARQLPTSGRPFCASHLELAIPDDELLSGWHAVNYLREWRGDSHWALIATHNLSGGEASILHNAWLGYEGDWLSLSRGNTLESIDDSWATLESKGLAADRGVTLEGLALRQFIEDETDRISALAWRLLGEDRSDEFNDLFASPCERLLARVDATAGTNYQPASRTHS